MTYTTPALVGAIRVTYPSPRSEYESRAWARF